MKMKMTRAQRRAQFFRAQAHAKWNEQKLEKARRKAKRHSGFILGDACPQLAALTAHAA